MTAPTKPPVPSLKIEDDTDLSAISEKTGWLEKRRVNKQTSKVAGKALQMLQEERVKSEANIALTSLKLSESAVRASLVGNAMPAIGALTIRVDAATTAVDQALTNSAMAETYTHLSNRAANINLARQLHAADKITADEADVVISFAQKDAKDDIERSRERMAQAKEAVAGLHEFAMKGIAAAKDRLQ